MSRKSRRSGLPTGVYPVIATDGRTTYRARWRDTEGRLRSKTFCTAIEAEEFRISQVQSVDTYRAVLRPDGSPSQTFAELWERWVEQRDVRVSTKSTYRALGQTHAVNRIGHLRLDELDRLRLQGLVSDLSEATYTRTTKDGHTPERALAPATIVKILSLVRSCLQFAVDERILLRNPADGVRGPKIEPREAVFLEMPALWRLEQAMDDWYETLIPFMAETGLRIGEAAFLRVSDVDFMRRRLFVRGTLVEVSADQSPDGASLTSSQTKTYAGNRVVPTLTSATATRLSKQVFERELGPESYLFGGRKGAPLRPSTFRSRQWKQATEKAGLDGITPHCLRHTAISIWVATGRMTTAQIAKMAGHTSEAFILKTYGHLIETDMTDTAAAIEAVMASGRD